MYISLILKQGAVSFFSGNFYAFTKIIIKSGAYNKQQISSKIHNPKKSPVKWNKKVGKATIINKKHSSTASKTSNKIVLIFMISYLNTS